MADLKQFANDHQTISNNYRFWKFLREKKASKFQYFFDTADIIDMLTGIHGLSRGYTFKWPLYEHLKQLVYAVAYQHWLGSITLLPPHLSELYDKIKTSEFIFPEQPVRLNHPKEEFWGKYIPENVGHFIRQPGDDHGSDIIQALMETAPHIFQGVYLLQENSFWKKRYKYLIERNIIKLDTAPYDVIEISKDPIFKALQNTLNEERPHNTSNNYIDALALCLFDRKLQKHEREPESEPLPIFYSDQEHLLKATQQFKRHRIDDRHPFHVRDKGQSITLLVRDANFFFLSGILQGAEQEDVKLFERLNNCFNSIKESGDQDLELIDARAKMNRNIKEDAPLALLLEFFKRWWRTRGIDELKEVFEKDYHLDDQQEQALNQEINEYIAEEQKRLEQDLGQGPFVLSLLRQAWKDLHEVENRFKELYSSDIKIDAAHEFGSRFSFNKRVYEKIQEHFNKMKAAAYGEEAKDIDEVKTETVNYIFDALTSKGELPEEERIKKLDNLASAIGILWLLEKNDLIDNICEALSQSPALKKDKRDEYPSPAFAIMHAVVRLALEEPSLVDIQIIIDCVERKFNDPQGQKNYKVWMALSYVYYRMATVQYPYIHEIPEDLAPVEMESNARKEALNYLEKTCCFAEKSISYLETKIPYGSKSEELHRWRRVYYYALNNFIFTKTLSLSSGLEEELGGRVRQLELLNDGRLFHENRYSDTLARYYYRLAYHSRNEEKAFHFNIKQAKKFNQRSLDSMGTAERRVFETLGASIDRLEVSVT